MADLAENEVSQDKVRKLFIKDSGTGKEYNVEIPADSLIKDALLGLSLELKISSAQNFILSNKTQGFVYEENDTFLSRGTQNNDLCVLQYEPVLGGQKGKEKEVHEEKIRQRVHRVFDEGGSKKLIDDGTFPTITKSMLEKDKGGLAFLVYRYFELEKSCNVLTAQNEILTKQSFCRFLAAILYIIAQIVIGAGVTVMMQKVQGAWLVVVTGLFIFLGGLFFSIWPTKQKCSD